MLRDQRPDAVSAIRHPDADDRRADRAAKCRKEEPLEQHIARDIRLLDVLHAGDHQREAQDADNRRQLRHSIESRDEWRRREHERVQSKAHRHIEVEHGGNIKVIRVLLLHQCAAHAAVDEHLHDGSEDCNEGDGAVHGGVEQAGENDGDDERYALGADALEEAPEEVGKKGFSYAHCFISFLFGLYVHGKYALMYSLAFSAVLSSEIQSA